MKYNVYVFLDKVTHCISFPFFALGDEDALRSYYLQQAKNLLCRDTALYCVGTFDNVSGFSCTDMSGAIFITDFSEIDAKRILHLDEVNENVEK